MKIERHSAHFRSEPLEDPAKRGTVKERVMSNEGLQGAGSVIHPLAYVRGSEQRGDQRGVSIS